MRISPRGALGIVLILFASTEAVAGPPGGPTSKPTPIHTIYATPQPKQVPQSPALDNGLATLKSMITPDTYRQLGFSTLDEANSAKLGVPAVRYYVSLSSIQHFTVMTTKPLTLLMDKGVVVYPVVVYPVSAAPVVRSSIDFVHRNGAWSAEAFGRANFIKAMDSARRADMVRTGTPEAAYGVVDVPALERSFLRVVDSSGALFLIPIRDEPALKFTAGVRLPATTVFLMLRPLALEMGPTPPPS